MTGAPPEDTAPEIRVFISYRREDVPAHAARMFEALSDELGRENVFMDIDTIEIGVAFRKAIDTALNSCDFLLAMIGPRWLAAVDRDGNRRLDNSHDLVRVEIEAALRRGVTVVPVLIDGTHMPDAQDLPKPLMPLTELNAAEVSAGRHWQFDVGQVVGLLKQARQARDRPNARPSDARAKAEQRRRRRGSEPAAVREPRTAAGEPKAVGRQRPPPVVQASVPEHARRTVGDRLRGIPLLWQGAIALALVLAGVGTYVLTRGSSMTVANQSAIVNELLLPHVPAHARGDCAIVTPPNATVFLRSVRCPQSSSNGFSATYSRSDSGAGLKSFFTAAAQKQLSGCGKMECFPVDSCAQRSGTAAAGDAWTRKNNIGHNEIGESADAKLKASVEGRVLCFTRGQTAWIAWTDTPTKIYATASRPASQWPQLLAWWSSSAGPDKSQAMMTTGMTMAWPDDLESELLLAHIPGANAKVCSRATPNMGVGLIRAVTCPDPAGTGAKATFDYAHDVDALRAHYTNNLQAEGQLTPSGSPTTACSLANSTGESWWQPAGGRGHTPVLEVSGMVHGRVSCFIDDAGRPTIEWYDTGAVIYAIAKGAGKSDWPALYRWWENAAGPTAARHGGPPVGSTGGSGM